MPSKGKRVASRQNNLRRRRNATGRPAVPVANAVNAPAAQSAVESVPATAAAATSANGVSSNEESAVNQVGARRIQQPRGRRFERPAAYNYVGSEMVRIGIYAGVLLVGLIAVSFVI
jgi:hypothetical protein